MYLKQLRHPKSQDLSILIRMQYVFQVENTYRTELHIDSTINECDGDRVGNSLRSIFSKVGLEVTRIEVLTDVSHAINGHHSCQYVSAPGSIQGLV